MNIELNELERELLTHAIDFYIRVVAWTGHTIPAKLNKAHSGALICLTDLRFKIGGDIEPLFISQAINKEGQDHEPR